MTLFYDDCKSFPQLLQYIRSRTKEEFISQVALGFVVQVSPIVKSTLPLAKKYDAKPEEVNNLKECSCYGRERQDLEPMSVYDFTIHLLEHLDSYEKAFSLFQDDWSQLTFFHMIMFRLLPYTGTHLDQMRSDSFLYFRKELLEEGAQGVLVDVGSYLGDGPLKYLQSYGDNYDKIYLFEPNPVSMERCKGLTAPLPNVIYSSTALANHTGTGHFCFNDSFSHLHPSQGETVSVDTLDHAVTEPITFLKISVAGGEFEALQGATNHLTEDKPNVALSISHVVSHLFQIPLYLKELNPNQSFHLRYHGVKDSTIGFTLYANPKASSTGTSAAPLSGALPSTPPVSDLDAQLKAAMAALGGGTATPPVQAAPVTTPPVSDLDAQLKAAMAALGGGTATPPVQAAPVTTPPVSDLDAQLKAAMASLGGGTATPPVQATPVTTPPVSDLDAQLKAAMAALGGGTATPPVQAAPVTTPPVSDLDAQLKAAMASLGGGTATPPVQAAPVSDLDAQLQAMKAKLTAMSSGLERVTGQSSTVEKTEIQPVHGLTFSTIVDDVAMPTPVPAIPVAVPATPVVPPVKRTENALALIETMTEGVQYLRSTCESDSPEFHSIMESLELSLDALSRNLKD